MNILFRRIYLLLFVFCFLLLTACTRMPDVQGKGETFLQGVWNQDSVPNARQLLNYTQHHFKFTCDSFYVDLTTHAKVNYYEASCFNGGVWKEYAKGTYAVKGDTLILVGNFTKANYKQKVSGCYRNGQYLNNFKIKSSDTDRLILENLNDQKECSLVLKEKITCVPKEL
ncbi:MAG: fumarate hydratase [Bacteroidota bacterium]